MQVNWLQFLPGRRAPSAPQAGFDPHARFFENLAAVARPAGGGAHAFVEQDGTCRGFVQFIPGRGPWVTLHRLWTLSPGAGNGSVMLRIVCRVADCSNMEIRLKPLPFGRKPYRFTSQQLVAWYTRYGFAGTTRQMMRRPVEALRTL